MRTLVLVALWPAVLSSAAETSIKAGGAEIVLVRISAGQFQMGSNHEGEGPRHVVRVRAFDLGKTEVTVGQFRAFTRATGYKTDAEKENSSWLCRGPQQPDAGWRSRGYWSVAEGVNWRHIPVLRRITVIPWWPSVGTMQ